MRAPKTLKPANGFTLIELLAIIFVFIAGLVVLQSWYARSRARASKVNCVSVLKQVGISMRMWANDHSDMFPMNVSTAQGGSMEYSGEVYRHFQAASNELSSPRVLVCPDDPRRTRTNDFAQLRNGNISYFLALTADQIRPQTILSGDRDFEGKLTPEKVISVRSNSLARWKGEVHPKGDGNVAFADSSVMQVPARTPGLFSRFTNEWTRLAIPIP